MKISQLGSNSNKKNTQIQASNEGQDYVFNPNENIPQPKPKAANMIPQRLNNHITT